MRILTEEEARERCSEEFLGAWESGLCLLDRERLNEANDNFGFAYGINFGFAYGIHWAFKTIYRNDGLDTLALKNQVMTSHGSKGRK